MDGIANQVVMQSKANAKLEDLEAKRDLMSVLVKANVSQSAGESTSHSCGGYSTISNLIHRRTRNDKVFSSIEMKHTAVQVKLRNELVTLSTDNPSMEELNSLPYLETVVREVMRFHAPVNLTLTKAGKSHNSLVFDPQGPNDPHSHVNTDKEIWGEDAREFKPKRWENFPDVVSLVPGVWVKLLTFFAGTTNCIGFRFSLVEHVSLSSLVCD
ncbi:cytochrome P450 [Mycena olivaceomarginata]|nr:cytochrome P450 [Mycena olivaceomarginata]